MVAGSTQLSATVPITRRAGDAGAVETVALSVLMGQRRLLDRVSVRFEPHRITAIVGPTGCGKTTLLRAINRLHDHTPGLRVTGAVWIGNDDVYGPDVKVRELRRRVGMLFQKPNPFPQTIANNIGLAPRAHGLISRRDVPELVEERLREVGLWDAVADRLGQSPFTLSGGQQQLLCLARALALCPSVLLLDEPTSALDPATTAHIESLLLRLRQRVTVLLVTHNLAQANRISDNVVFLRDGALVEAAAARKFFDAPEDVRTVEYVSGRIG